MIWYGMTWGDIISYDVVWYGLCKGEHMGVHWDMDWQMKDAVISKKDEDWTCRESVSNSRGCFNGWNEQVETCWNRQLEGLSNKHLTKILLRNPHPQACLVGALESISPDPETSSDFWNHRKLLLHQWHQVTSSDIKWHQVTSGVCCSLCWLLRVRKRSPKMKSMIKTKILKAEKTWVWAIDSSSG